MLAFTGDDARVWEPKRLRLRLFSIAGSIAHHSRRTWLHLCAHAPHVNLIVARHLDGTTWAWADSGSRRNSAGG